MRASAVMALVRDALVATLHGFLHGLSHDDDRIRGLSRFERLEAE